MEPRKIVGRKQEGDRLRRLEQLNRSVQRLMRPDAKLRASMKDGAGPPRKIVGRPWPR